MVSFTDIQNNFYQPAIVQLEQKKIVSGYPEGDFRPNGTITRAEFAALLLKAFPDVKPVRNAINFTDVPNNHWAYNAIKSAYEKGFISGYPDQTFKPNQTLPRAQALIIIASGLKYSSPSPSREMLKQYFDDAMEIPDYAINGVSAAIFENIIINYPDIKKLKPNNNSTRGEIAGLIAQSLKIPNTIPKQYIAGLNLLELPVGFTSGSEFSQGLAAITNSNNLAGYMDKNGQVVIPAKFRGALRFTEELAGARTGQFFGYIDKTGNFIIPEKYGTVQPFSQSLAAILVNETPNLQYSFINKAGQLINNQNYGNPKPFSEGLAAVEINGKIGYINTAGQIIIQPQFQQGESFSEGLALVKQPEGKWGYIDNTGQFIIPPQYYDNEATSFSGGLASVKLGEKYGYINKKGQIVIQPQFDIAYPFSEGLAMVKNYQGDASTAGKFGAIDQTGKIVINPQFQYVESFSEGLALVAIPNTNKSGVAYGYIDKAGKYVIYPQFGFATSFKEGMALISVGGKWRYDNTIGDNVFEGGRKVFLRHPLK